MPYNQRVTIGGRRERVTIQRAETTDDGMGGQRVTKWKTCAEPWAKVMPHDERRVEGIDAAQLTAKHAYHFAIPYTTSVTARERLLWREKTLEIHTVVDPDQRRRKLILQCIEVQ